MARQVPPPARVAAPVNVRAVRGPFAGPASFKIEDDTILFDTTAGARVASLPSAASVPAGTQYQATISTGANAITLTPAGTDTIEGAATLSITAAMSTARVISNGSNTWFLAATGS